MSNFPLRYERERRFLVRDPHIVEECQWVMITQAYVFAEDGYAVRLRRIQEPQLGKSEEFLDLDATVAVKGPRIGDEREEYETPVDALLAAEIIKRSPYVIRKRRYQVIDHEAWDVDVFLDENEGLIIAEIEGREVRHILPPSWAGKEVTTEQRYNNEELALRPVSKWDKRATEKTDSLWDF